METDLKILLKNGFISRKQYRQLLSRNPGSRELLREILLEEKMLDPPDMKEAEPLLSPPRTGDLEPPETKNGTMISIQETAMRVARVDTTVLLLGESGVGKSRLARMIHHNSLRRSGPFITFSCGSIPETLLESELFGVEKGAYTGAVRTREGRFITARGGTIFLDEVGELTAPLQVKLLRAIQEKKVEPLGSGREVEVDVRIIAATNRILERDVEEGRFREDLYFRLNVVPLTIPPLRERKEDIIPLVRYFLKRLQLKDGVPYSIADPDVMAILLAYNWPGNIRELENCMERMAVLSRDGKIAPQDFPPKILKEIHYRPGFARLEEIHRHLHHGDHETMEHLNAQLAGEPRSLSPEEEPILMTLREMEERHIRTVLEHSGGNQNLTASILGIHRNTLARKLEEFHIDPYPYKKRRENPN